MNKVLSIFSFMGLIFLAVGTIVMPNDMVFWFASTSNTFQVVRASLGVILLAQLVTRPPRHLWFRLIAGAFSVTSLVWIVQETYLYHMPLLDGFVFAAASLAILVTAIERKYILTPVQYSATPQLSE